MSWSVQFLGSPEKVVEALDKFASDWPEGNSKTEYNEAKSHLIGLVKQCVGDKAVSVVASGHASFSNGNKNDGNISVQISQIYGLLK